MVITKIVVIIIMIIIINIEQVGSSGNVSDFYSGYAQFDPRPGR
jgi:hypothetical protein